QPNNGRTLVVNTNLAPIRGGFDNLLQDARTGLVDVIYVVSPLRAEQRIKDLIFKLADTTASVYVVPDFFTFDLLRARWMSLAGIPAVSIHDTPFDGVDGVFKRMEDIIVGSICLVVVAIPMVFIAIGIRLSSPGAILFKQLRYGINGEKIGVWKFRTMTVCEDGASVNQAKEKDPRVTDLGRFLRRTSMDELPQFINVLQGQMSIVGPRPHAVAHNEEYRSLLQGYMLRHKVKPGITGWAQINGLRGETDTLDKMQRRLQFDLDYIQSWSPYFDLKIILTTIFIVFLGKNAY
ncbi:MAG: undecaprenyl-phosphate glucose phosphotransferase, partial [Gammaproteobacteria bacterium]